MDPIVMASLFAGSLFLGMLLLLEIGRRIGVRRRAADTEAAREGVGVVDGAVFGLLGLLVAFTFSGATARFDMRRSLTVEEANNIGTAYLRLDLLPAAKQAPLRESFRRYVDSRLETYRRLPDLRAAKEELARGAQLQSEIWAEAIVACRESPESAALLLLPALNQMIDITTTRTMAAQMHPPWIIFIMLGGLALATSLLAGYGMAGAKSRDWLHMIGFAGIIAISVYVIIDIEFPRLGLIRVDAFDQALVEIRNSMK